MGDKFLKVKTMHHASRQTTTILNNCQQTKPVMKSINKILYYVSVAGSVLVLSIFLLGPYSGFGRIVCLVRDGMYSGIADANEHTSLFRFRQLLGFSFGFRYLFAWRCLSQNLNQGLSIKQVQCVF